MKALYAPYELNFNYKLQGVNYNNKLRRKNSKLKNQIKGDGRSKRRKEQIENEKLEKFPLAR